LFIGGEAGSIALIALDIIAPPARYAWRGGALA